MRSRFAKQFQKLLKNSNYNQKTLAAVLHTTQQSVSSWITGKYEPDIDTIYNICYYLETTPNELFDYSESDTKAYIENDDKDNGND